jgi:hypothetical protein
MSEMFLNYEIKVSDVDSDSLSEENSDNSYNDLKLEGDEFYEDKKDCS